MRIPTFPELGETIDASATRDLNYLVTNGPFAGKQRGYYQPFTGKEFGNVFRDAVRAASLDGISAHGLRKSAAQRLALKSHSTNEIAAIGGWETLSEVQRYTKGANRRVLAQKVKDREDE